MSSLFNKTTGINLSSVLGNHNNQQQQQQQSSSKLHKYHTTHTPKQNLLVTTNITQNSHTNTNNNNTPVKQFSDKLKLHQHQYALNTNNYLKTIDNCLEEASRTGDLLLASKSLIEFL